MWIGLCPYGYFGMLGEEAQIKSPSFQEEPERVGAILGEMIPPNSVGLLLTPRSVSPEARPPLVSGGLLRRIYSCAPRFVAPGLGTRISMELPPQKVAFASQQILRGRNAGCVVRAGFVSCGSFLDPSYRSANNSRKFCLSDIHCTMISLTHKTRCPKPPGFTRIQSHPLGLLLGRKWGASSTTRTLRLLHLRGRPPPLPSILGFGCD